jgi:hypothetical protein
VSLVRARHAPLAALLALAACATPAQRIERTLIEEGVPPAMARCLGERLDERLTIAELRRLGRVAARIARTDWRGLTIGQAELVARDLDDPRLVRAIAVSGFDCLTRR